MPIIQTLRKMLEQNKDMRTALQYMGCLILTTLALWLYFLLKYPGTTHTVMLRYCSESSFCIALHCSGILIGILITRVSRLDARLEQDAERNNANSV
jgi:hypothetical protein